MVSRVLGTPTLRKAQKVRAHLSFAFCTTIRLATLPTIVRLPASVLEAAKANHNMCGPCTRFCLRSMTNGTLLNRLLPTTEPAENLVRPARLEPSRVKYGTWL